MEKTKEKILSNIAKAVNSAPDKQQYFLGLAEGMALMAEEKKAEKPTGRRGHEAIEKEREAQAALAEALRRMEEA